MVKIYEGKVNIHNIIGLVISQRRKYLGMSQKRFAEYLEVTNSSVSKIEAGSTVLSLDNLILALSVLDFELDALSYLLKNLVQLLEDKYNIYVFSPRDLKLSGHENGDFIEQKPKAYKVGNYDIIEFYPLKNHEAYSSTYRALGVKVNHDLGVGDVLAKNLAAIPDAGGSYISQFLNEVINAFFKYLDDLTLLERHFYMLRKDEEFLEHEKSSLEKQLDEPIEQQKINRLTQEIEETINELANIKVLTEKLVLQIKNSEFFSYSFKKLDNNSYLFSNLRRE